MTAVILWRSALRGFLGADRGLPGLIFGFLLSWIFDASSADQLGPGGPEAADTTA